MATFVLVHGGWHGGWVYKPLARLLRAAGHEVYVATLTGLGERSHLVDLPINLDVHIADVMNIIIYEQLQDVMLVGHSYGGMVTTGVADRLPSHIASLVYVDAIVPNQGDTLLSLRPQYAELFLKRAALGGGRLVAPNKASSYDCRPEFWALLDANVSAHPLACFTQSLNLSGAYRKVESRLYIYAKGGAFQEGYIEIGKISGDLVFGIDDAGHTVMLDQPDNLSEILHSFASSRQMPIAGS